MAGEIQDIDHGFRALTRQLRAADDLAVTIGVQGKAALASTYEGTDASNLQIAATNELGWPAKNIPKRSYLKATLDAKQAEYAALIGHLMAQMVSSKGKFTARKALNTLGTRVTADVKARIKAGIAPDLALSTIRWRARMTKSVAARLRRGRKKEGKSAMDMAGTFTPLLHKGTLIRSITWKVRKKFGRTLNP